MISSIIFIANFINDKTLNFYHLRLCIITSTSLLFCLMFLNKQKHIQYWMFCFTLFFPITHYPPLHSILISEYGFWYILLCFSDWWDPQEKVGVIICSNVMPPGRTIYWGEYCSYITNKFGVDFKLALMRSSDLIYLLVIYGMTK